MSECLKYVIIFFIAYICRLLKTFYSRIITTTVIICLINERYLRGKNPLSYVIYKSEVMRINSSMKKTRALRVQCIYFYTLMSHVYVALSNIIHI